MVISATDVAEGRVLPRSLPGATVLQVAPALTDDETGRATLEVARALIHSGSRAIVAARHGPLVDPLRGFGGEWLSLAEGGYGSGRNRANAARLKRFFADERVDIVHVRDAYEVREVLDSLGPDRVGLIAELPDLSTNRMRLAALRLGALARCDRLIARSLHAARPLLDRYRIEPQRVAVMPHGVDIATFDPASILSARVAALRKTWGIPSGVRLILVPGAVRPAHGQSVLVDVAHLMRAAGAPPVTFVLVGDDRRHRLYAHRMLKLAAETGVSGLFRLVGECSDMPAAYAAAAVVMAPYRTATGDLRPIAEAQVMARPAVVTDTGALPEAVLAPPRMPDDLRTGWVVPSGDAQAMARALTAALSLDVAAYRALAARSHEFGLFMFSPDRTAAATLDIYRTVLEEDG